jgi:hypothetical protein
MAAVAEVEQRHQLLQEQQCHSSVKGLTGFHCPQGDPLADQQHHSRMHTVAMGTGVDMKGDSSWWLPSTAAAVAPAAPWRTGAGGELPTPVQHNTWQQQQQQQCVHLLSETTEMNIRLQHQQVAAASGMAAADFNIKLVPEPVSIGKQLQVQAEAAATGAGPIWQLPTKLMSATGTEMLITGDLALPPVPGVGCASVFAQAHPVTLSTAHKPAAQAERCGQYGIVHFGGEQQLQQQQKQKLSVQQQQQLQRAAALLQKELNSINDLLQDTAGPGCAVGPGSARIAAPSAAANLPSLNLPMLTVQQATSQRSSDRQQLLLHCQTEAQLMTQPAARQLLHQQVQHHQLHQQQDHLIAASRNMMSNEAREWKLQMLLQQSQQQMVSLRTAWAAFKALSI